MLRLVQVSVEGAPEDCIDLWQSVEACQQNVRYQHLSNLFADAEKVGPCTSKSPLGKTGTLWATNDDDDDSEGVPSEVCMSSDGTPLGFGRHNQELEMVVRWREFAPPKESDIPVVPLPKSC